MTTQPAWAADQPLGILEYEFTDDLAFRAIWAHFDHQARGVKEGIVREGMPHPALPIVIASVTLLIALAASLVWAWDFFPTPYLFVLGCLVELLLLFKAALYFYPPFARWYVRRLALRMARRMESRTICWTFFEDRLETKVGDKLRCQSWTDLRRLDVLPEFWCLHWKSRVQLIVPAAVLPTAMQTLILRKACEAGAAGTVVLPGDGNRIME
jgi:hypothetical protein